jgi:hypothetical protein
MSAFDRRHPGILSRPWFASLAMTIGVSVMAFGAYSAENSPSFATHSLRPVPALAAVTVERKLECLPAQVQSDTLTINLDEVRITGKSLRQQAHEIHQEDTCAQNWRSLAMGPATQQVREVCLTPSNGTFQPTLSKHPKAGASQQSTPPRAQHNNDGIDEERQQPNSPRDLVPPDPNERWLETNR